MIRVLDAHKAHPHLALRHSDRRSHRQVRSDEAEAIVGVDVRYARGDLGERGLCRGREDGVADARDVAGDAVDAVRGDAAQVGEDQAVGDEGGVFGGDRVGLEDAFDEGLGGCGWDRDGFVGGLGGCACGRHGLGGGRVFFGGRSIDWVG